MKMKNKITFGVLLVISILFLTGCTQSQKQQEEKLVCPDACSFTGVQCDGKAFYTCEDVNLDGCKEKNAIVQCGADYSCASPTQCTSAGNPAVLEVKPVADQGACEVVKVVQDQAVVRCSPVGEEKTRYVLECTKNCDRGVNVVTQSYAPLTTNAFSDQFTVSLKNENKNGCAMACTVLQGVNYQVGKEGTNEQIALAPGMSSGATLRTRTPTSMQVLCTEVPDAAGKCSDYVRQIFTSRWVVPSTNTAV